MKRKVRLGFLTMTAAMLAACKPVPAPAIVETDAPPPTETAPAAPQAAAPSTSRDPQVVLSNWASAVERRDWQAVRSYWGEGGTRSGMDEAPFAARWSVLTAPQVRIGSGEMEGAAGSLYYTALISISDGDKSYRGTITLRRVNDVPGATAEQLRWHIESTSLPL